MKISVFLIILKNSQKSNLILALLNTIFIKACISDNKIIEIQSTYLDTRGVSNYELTVCYEVILTERILGITLVYL